MKRKTYTAFVVDGPRRSCRCTKDEAGSRPILRASAKDFDVIDDANTINLRWLGGKDGKQNVGSFTKPRFGYAQEGNEHVIYAGGEIDRDDLNFTGVARSDGEDINIYRGGQETAVERVGDSGHGRMTASKMQATIERTRHVWGQVK